MQYGSNGGVFADAAHCLRCALLPRIYAKNLHKTNLFL